MTYVSDETTHSQAPRKKRRKWPWIVGAVLVLGGFGALIDGDEEAPQATPAATTSQEPTAEATTESTTPEPTGEPEPTTEPVEDRFAIEHDADDLGGLIPGGTTTVSFDIADNFSQGMIASGAERDTFEAIELALAEHPDTGRVLVLGSFPTVDEYGNQEHTVIMRPHYDRATIDQINFDNQHAVDIWAIRDGGMIHRNLEG